MARLTFVASNSAAQALVAATAKTVLQIVAPTNQRVAVPQFSISFNGIDNSAVPVVIKVFKQTSAGTSSAGTIQKKDNDIGTALQTTARDTFTVEPTSTDLVGTFYCHPQTGQLYPYPLPGGEIIVKGGERLGIVCTAPAAVSALCNIEGEE